RPPISPLFPYTTLFRSPSGHRRYEDAMSRRSKGARLWLKPEERDAGGRLRKRATWVIRDGARSIVTGCAASDIEGAERKLREYRSEEHTSELQSRENLV